LYPSRLRQATNDKPASLIYFFRGSKPRVIAAFPWKTAARERDVAE